MTDFEALIRRLDEAGVRYVLVGGFAGTVRGSPRITVDLDIVYARDGENLERLSRALEPLHPHLRGAPKDLPFRLDVPTLKPGLNFTLTTDAGDLPEWALRISATISGVASTAGKPSWVAPS